MNLRPPSHPYQTHQTAYFNANENSKLDAVILDPHGYDGFNNHPNGTEFFDIFNDFESICILSRTQLEELCKSECDRFCPEVGQQTAQKLGALGYRVALFSTLLPRELIDANRTKDRAVKWLFDQNTHSKWVKLFSDLYSQAIEAEANILNRLDLNGKFLEIHSMRPFDVNNEHSHVMDAPKNLTNIDEWTNYFHRKLQFLKNPEMQNWNRKHCLMTRTEIEGQSELSDIIVDEKILENLVKLLDETELKYTHNEPYHGAPHIKSTQNLIKWPGLAFDINKADLAIFDNIFDLANLKANPKAINQMSDILSQTLNLTLKPN